MSNEIQVGVPGSTKILKFQESVRLGRLDTNGIIVDDPYVSGKHVELRRTGDGWEIVDLGSRNGTFINGERITRAPLGHVNRVRLGHPEGPELRIKVPGLAPARERGSYPLTISSTGISATKRRRTCRSAPGSSGPRCTSTVSGKPTPG